MPFYSIRSMDNAHTLTIVDLRGCCYILYTFFQLFLDRKPYSTRYITALANARLYVFVRDGIDKDFLSLQSQASLHFL